MTHDEFYFDAMPYYILIFERTNEQTSSLIVYKEQGTL